MLAFDLSLDRRRLHRIRDGAVVVITAPAVFRIDGAGALQCLQGILTNDVAHPGDNSLIYGALLTPKGMVVVDYWVLRHAGGFTLVGPAGGHEASLTLFKRQLPPRLATVTDLTGESRVAWLIGGHAFQVLAKAAPGALPEASGRVTSIETGSGAVALALAPETAPFSALAVGANSAIGHFVAALGAAGAAGGDEADLETSRILSGWPALGAEIDERTLPQEVRYDEIGGVSYTKGCYTGQETVARLHFRGHTNRELRGLRWQGVDPLDGRAILYGGKEVGTVRSTLVLDDRIVGLAPIRREVAVGETVSAGGRSATVVALPFAAGDLDG